MPKCEHQRSPGRAATRSFLDIAPPKLSALLGIGAMLVMPKASAGDGFTAVHPEFNNDGVVSVDPGGALLFREFRQTSGVTKVDGTCGTLWGPGKDTNTFKILGGGLTGNGLVVGPVEISGGNVTAGTDGWPGLLTVTNGLYLKPFARVTIKLRGVLAGINHDVVRVDGPCDLGRATLSVNVSDDFALRLDREPGLVFDVIRAPHLTNIFGNVIKGRVTTETYTGSFSANLVRDTGSPDFPNEDVLRLSNWTRETRPRPPRNMWKISESP